MYHKMPLLIFRLKIVFKYNTLRDSVFENFLVNAHWYSCSQITFLLILGIVYTVSNSTYTCSCWHNFIKCKSINLDTLLLTLWFSELMKIRYSVFPILWYNLMVMCWVFKSDRLAQIFMPDWYLYESAQQKYSGTADLLAYQNSLRP